MAAAAMALSVTQNKLNQQINNVPQEKRSELRVEGDQVRFRQEMVQKNKQVQSLRVVFMYKFHIAAHDEGAKPRGGGAIMHFSLDE